MKTLLMSMLLVFAAQSPAAAQNATGAVKLQGQIVCCEECWAKADRTTVEYGAAADLAQAAQCIAKGDPTLLAVMSADGKTTFYQLEPGAYKRTGKNWLEYVGKRVEITGPIRSRKKVLYIKVDELNVLSSPTVRPEISSQSVIGTEAELVLKDLLGVEQHLSSYRGRIVVLNFWATYCVPCRKEMPDLASIQNQYAALGVQVIGASSDGINSVTKVRQFIKETRINFPIWIGATAGDMERFGLGSALPGTLVIGRDGKIVASIRGVIKPSDLRKQIEGLLAQSERQPDKEIESPKAPSDKASSVPS